MTQKVHAKLEQVREEVRKERGCDFFEWVLPLDHEIEFWDVVVSADWLTTNQKEGIKYLAGKLNAKLKGDIIHISHIQPVKKEDLADVQSRIECWGQYGRRMEDAA